MLIEELLEMTVKAGASDLHLSSGLQPVIRVGGVLQRTNYPVLTPDELDSMLFPMLNNEQRRTLEQTWELDLSYGITGIGRFRVNIYKDKGSYAAAFRTISSSIPKFEDLGLPDIVKKITERPRGLILVTGPTGSGKSTTLACMIDHINETRAEHILIIEDPIEFIHKSKKSIVHQRELGQDTRSFSNALRSALREDPDIILVGEMRDLETISLALTAAETGHLVMGTLHTSSASQTIDRILDVFPEMQQQQVKIQLASSLIAVFSQTLLPMTLSTGEKKGRVMAQEIMIVNPAISNLIREGKTAQIYSSIQTGASYGMQTLEKSLQELYLQKKISVEDALSKSQRPDEFRRLTGIDQDTLID
ncbi:MAG: type IV pilus twitching motility protein PilT [Candidatus Gastranaerophilaceae bacterium]